MLSKFHKLIRASQAGKMFARELWRLGDRDGANQVLEQVVDLDAEIDEYSAAMRKPPGFVEVTP